MREIIEPVTKRVFEGEGCRVIVERTNMDDEPILIHVDPHNGDQYRPEEFAAVARDLASVNDRVQEVVREMLRDAGPHTRTTHVLVDASVPA